MTNQTPKPTQLDKFKQAARELETDDSEERFDAIVRHIAAQGEDRIFRLWPVEGSEDHRDWATSTLKPTSCWVRAHNADDARMLLHLATVVAVKVEPGTPARTSPWTNPKLTGCAPDNPRIDVPNGIVVTEGGKTITVNE